MKILYITDNSAGTGYLNTVMARMSPDVAKVTMLKLGDYICFNDDGYDVLIYNTFPDQSHPHKFRRDLIDATDKLFLAFSRKKILFDSHDDGLSDGFSRFEGIEIPRIKLTPGEEYLKRFNVILSIPYKIQPEFLCPKDFRTEQIVYCARLDGYRDNLRAEICKRLQKFNVFTDRLQFEEYSKLLCSAMISVTAPGWGIGCFSHGEALASGCVLFAHDSVKKIKVLPYSNLEDGINYVSFNLENIEDRLIKLLEYSGDREEIRQAGVKAFKEGYSYERSEKDLITFIRRAI